MVNKLILLLLLVTGFLLQINVAYAEGEFASSYDISYDVDPSGLASVTEKIILRNLTDRYYASRLNLSIGATQISDVAASDSQGPLDTQSRKEGKKTSITVNFNQQVAGKDKEYAFTLKFKSRDFVQVQGKTWQVTIPKVTPASELDKSSLTLTVPVSFNDPTSISPEPAKQFESGGRLNYVFSGSQLRESGVVANFGSNQVLDFNLGYSLTNSGFLPKVMEVPIPSDGSYQQVLINSITPKPENVYYDADGNSIAQFRLERGQTIQVKVSGLVNLLIKRRTPAPVLSGQQQVEYTKAQRYWEKSSPQLLARLAEIFRGQNVQTNQEKARLIDRYVVSTLSYDRTRLQSNDFERLGALTALNNPQRALCSEFSDLFIALARAADIPARQLIGYAYSANTDIRPLSLQSNSVLHSWVEYYDPRMGWVMVDPTWENTTGGVDYFSKFDLSHFVLLTRGVSSTSPNPPNSVQVNFSESQLNPTSDTVLSLDAPEQMFANLPAALKVRIENRGNSATDSLPLTLSSSKLDIKGPKSFNAPRIPPGGKLEYEFSVQAQSLWSSYDDILQLRLGDKALDKKVTVKPFFAYRFFTAGLVAVALITVAAYLGVVFLHVKYPHRLKLHLPKDG